MAFAIPMYLKHMGSEGFGLVSFFISLQMVLHVLDFGLSATINREVSSRLFDKSQLQELRNTVASIERLYIAVAFTIGLFFLTTSDFITTKWLHLEDPTDARLSVILLGAVVAARWPVSMYMGVLRGAERQVLLNILALSFNLAKTGGAILVIVYFSNNVSAYAAWQLAITSIEVLAFHKYAWKTLASDQSDRSIASLRHIKRLFHFTAGIATASITAAVIKQSDKLVLSKYLPLGELGNYYSAVFVTTGIGILVSSVVSAYYPIFSKLHAQKNLGLLEIKFHETAKLVSLSISPLIAALFFFSDEILKIWLGSKELANNIGTPLKILALATLLNAMMQPIQNMLFASGITWLSAANNFVALIFFVPTLIYLTLNHGIDGAATAWLIYNTMYFIIFPYFATKQTGIVRLHKWYLIDISPYAAIAFVMFYLISHISDQIQPSSHTQLYTLILILTGILSYYFFMARHVIFHTTNTKTRTRQ